MGGGGMGGEGGGGMGGGAAANGGTGDGGSAPSARPAAEVTLEVLRSAGNILGEPCQLEVSSHPSRKSNT